MIPRRLSAVLLFALGSCATPAPPPAPPPRATAPPPRPAPPPVVAAGPDWRDWPLTPGDWSYRRTGGGSEAAYGVGGQPQFVLACGNNRQIRLTRAANPAGPMTVRTTSTARALSGGDVTLAASDPLLDAMGFSRGRFVVEGGGTTLVLPSWAEILRVAEDCRG